MILRVINRCDPLRADVEDYVRRVFARQYAATVRDLPERLVAVLGPGDAPLCAAGIRTAEDGFFSEFYLRSPVESVLGQVCGTAVQRSQIIEVTSLASERPGHAFMLLDYVTRLGRADGRTWGVFTATEKMRRCLGRVGFAIATLASAEAEAVPNRQDWGRYYEANPVVCALHDGCERPISFWPVRRPPAAPGGMPVMEVNPVD